ncbi:Plant GATA Transcription Factor [Abortiporus biennis]
MSTTARLPFDDASANFQQINHSQNLNQNTNNNENQSNASSSTLQTASSKPKEVFEFTKRKRWADLLITELSEAIILVLNVSGRVWYCGNSVHELLGWRDEELVDKDFVQFMNPDDRASFSEMLQASIRNQTELLTYSRLRCKPTNLFVAGANPEYQTNTKEVLFEIKGYPHYIPDRRDCSCYFAMAKPYPSRNTAMMNTFLELKMENERLLDRLYQLKQRQALQTPSSSSSVPTTTPPDLTSPIPSTFSTTGQSQYSLVQHQMARSMEPPPPPNSFYSGTYEELIPSPVNIRFDTSNNYRAAPSTGSAKVGTNGSVAGSVAEDDASGSKNTSADSTLPRKKQKKLYTTDQYVCVTCGRTDSPEWRKGPLGPKTLCNACGLRWAKSVRTSKEDGGTNA